MSLEYIQLKYISCVKFCIYIYSLKSSVFSTKLFSNYTKLTFSSEESSEGDSFSLVAHMYSCRGLESSHSFCIYFYQPSQKKILKTGVSAISAISDFYLFMEYISLVWTSRYAPVILWNKNHFLIFRAVFLGAIKYPA